VAIAVKPYVPANDNVMVVFVLEDQ